MEEKEHCDVADLVTLRNIKDMLRSLNCFDDPNKTRRMSVASNIDLMIDHVNKEIDIT